LKCDKANRLHVNTVLQLSINSWRIGEKMTQSFENLITNCLRSFVSAAAVFACGGAYAQPPLTVNLGEVMLCNSSNFAISSINNHKDFPPFQTNVSSASLSETGDFSLPPVGTIPGDCNGQAVTNGGCSFFVTFKPTRLGPQTVTVTETTSASEGGSIQLYTASTTVIANVIGTEEQGGFFGSNCMPTVAVSGINLNQGSGSLKVDSSGNRIFILNQPSTASVHITATSSQANATGAATVTISLNGQIAGSKTVALGNVGFLGADVLVPFTPGTPGVQTLTASVTTNIPGATGGSSSVTIDVQSPAIAISKVRVAQVVYNPTKSLSVATIDLVQGKSASFEVTLSGASLAASNELVDVEVFLGANVISKTLQPIPVQSIALAGASGYIITADKMSSFVTPASSTPLLMRVKVVPVSSTSAIATVEYNLSANSIKTYSPQIGILPISGCYKVLAKAACVPPVDTFQIAALLALQTYISDVFPFADQSVKMVSLTDSFIGSTDTTPVPGARSDVGITTDFIKLEVRKLLQTDGSANGTAPNRIMGIVPKGYFTFHNRPKTAGITWKARNSAGLIFHSQVALVTADAVDVLPHELGHTYGVNGDVDYAGDVSVTVPEGFNARAGSNESNIHAAISIMGASEMGRTQFDYWANPNRYTEWFRTATSTSIDPKVIYVSGMLFADGTFKLLESGISETGILTNDQQGDLRVQSVDGAGNILNSVTIASNYSVVATQQDDNFEDVDEPSEVSPIAVAIPFNANAVSVELIRNGSKIVAVNLVQLTIREILEKIPNSGFVLNPSVARFILAYEAKGIQFLINKHRNLEAAKAISLLEQELKNGIRDNYVIESPSQFTRTQVLSNLEILRKNLLAGSK
jgi:hypothetical protein